MLITAFIVYLLRYVLLPFAGAAAIAFVVTPLVDRLGRKFGGRRKLAGIIVFVAIVLLTVGGAWWIKDVLLPQSLDMARDLPRLIREIVSQMIDGREIHFLGRAFNTKTVTSGIDDTTNRLTASLSVVDLGAYAAAGCMGVFLVFVLLFYFLVSGPKIVEGIVWTVPPKYRPAGWDVVRQIRPMLFHYFFGLLVIVIYTTTAAWIGTTLIIHDTHAAVTAITVGVLELLPVVGPILSGILLAATAFERTQHLDLALGFVGFAIFLRLSIDQVVGPLVLGRAVTLHPVVIIFAFLAGGVLFGPLGVLLAIPAAATVKILLESAYGDSSGKAQPPH
jgi:predicted PurR-regulated permease PerM